jgi:hypothetical protein
MKRSVTVKSRVSTAILNYSPKSHHNYLRKIISLYSIIKFVSEHRGICIVWFGGENFVIWLDRSKDGDRTVL